MNWSDKTVLLTGAASGIGRALAQELADRNARLSLVDVDGDGLDSLTDSLSVPGEDLLVSQASVTQEETMESVVEQTERELDGIDVVVANAGLGYITPAADGSLSRTKQLLEVNLTGVTNTVVPALNSMLKTGEGHVVITSSVAAFLPTKGGASYSASKAGVLRFGESLRQDLRNEDISVTTLHPGWVRSNMTEKFDEELRMFEISAEEAAVYIRRGIEKDDGQVIFPWQARLLVALIRLLPFFIIDFVQSRVGSAEEFVKEERKA